jgi:hypothetical protein
MRKLAHPPAEVQLNLFPDATGDGRSGPDKLSNDVGLRPSTIRERVRIPSELEAAICQAYMADPNRSAREVGRMFGVTGACVRNALRRSGIPQREWIGKQLDQDTLRSRYEAGVPLRAMAEEFGVAAERIREILVTFGVRLRTPREARRTCSLREDAFDTIDEDAAYWIGYLMADGCVSEAKEGYYGHSARISISIKEADENHLRQFLEFVGSNRKLTRYTRGYTGRNKEFVQLKVDVSSDRLAVQLARYGVVPQKTHAAEVRFLEMNRDFWRGVIDGDGCIHIRKNGAPMLLITGSHRLVCQFREFVLVHAPDCGHSVRHDPRHAESISTFYVCRRDAARVLDVLYRDCKTALARKKALADSVIDDPEMFRDKRLNPRSNRPNLTLEMIEEQYLRLGTYAAVAKANGMHPSCLCTLKAKLKTEANG